LFGGRLERRVWPLTNKIGIYPAIYPAHLVAKPLIHLLALNKYHFITERISLEQLVGR
jgi:hypothetical protein